MINGAGPRILIAAGEASGDLHGANLATALLALRPDAELFGVGGVKMREAGVELIRSIDRFDNIGLVGFSQIRAAARLYRAVTCFLRKKEVDGVVLIDNPEVNLHLASAAKGVGKRVIYYIAPQIWAWRPGRIRLIKRVVDRMLVVLPFEEELYRRAGVPCDFVGHPLLDEVAPSYDRSELRKRFGLEANTPVVGLLPGSREREIRSLLPIMLESVTRLAGRHPGIRVLVAQAGSIRDDLLEEVSKAVSAGSSLGFPVVQVVKDKPSEVMAASDVLLVASGTATLQAAVVGTPMVIVYKVSRLTYWIGRALVRVKTIGLVNHVAGGRIVPELVQREATPAQLTREAGRLLDNDAAAQEMRVALCAIRHTLGSPGASRRAAAAVLAECLR